MLTLKNPLSNKNYIAISLINEEKAKSKQDTFIVIVADIPLKIIIARKNNVKNVKLYAYICQSLLYVDALIKAIMKVFSQTFIF